MEASSPFEDQGACLAFAMTAPDDKVHAGAHVPELSRGMPAVCKGSGGLPAPVLRLSPGSSDVIGDKRQESVASW